MKLLSYSTSGEEVPSQVASILSQNQHSTLKAGTEIAKSIDTIEKARACLDLTEKMLAQARERVRDYGFFQNRFGVRDASLSDIDQVSGWAKKIRNNLPKTGKPDELTRKKIGVVLVQASKTFKMIDGFALEEHQTNYLKEYFKALADIIRFTTTNLIIPALGASWQIWLPVAAVGVLILLAKNSPSTTVVTKGVS